MTVIPFINPFANECVQITHVTDKFVLWLKMNVKVIINHRTFSYSMLKLNDFENQKKDKYWTQSCITCRDFNSWFKRVRSFCPAFCCVCSINCICIIMLFFTFYHEFLIPDFYDDFVEIARPAHRKTFTRTHFFIVNMPNKNEHNSIVYAEFT